jgi:hypothetical protein
MKKYLKRFNLVLVPLLLLLSMYYFTYLHLENIFELIPLFLVLMLVYTFNYIIYRFDNIITLIFSYWTMSIFPFLILLFDNKATGLSVLLRKLDLDYIISIFILSSFSFTILAVIIFTVNEKITAGRSVNINV